MDANRATWEASPEGREQLAKQAAERAELDASIANDPGVVVNSWGGSFPEQWFGSVDDHSFYFREKRGHWRIEIDLRPTGRFYQRIVVPADPSEPADLDRVEQLPVEVGEVIAEGWAGDLGVTPLHHARFIVNTIRAQLRRGGCSHPGARRYCPDCGQHMD